MGRKDVIMRIESYFPETINRKRVKNANSSLLLVFFGLLIVKSLIVLNYTRWFLNSTEELVHFP